MKIKKFVTNNFLFLVLILAAILRLWKLGSIPPGLTPDEAALGYNAYSILKTGKDEYGDFFPFIFKSFGDYKPGLYVYLTVPFIAIFGLTEQAVRLPSALAGVFAVYLIFLIVREFIFLEKLEIKSLEFLASLFLAISPWHIHFSRGAWEANLSLTLTLAGIYFFLKSFKNSKFLILSSLFFSATLLTYQGAKMSFPIVILVLVLVFWQRIKEFFSARTTLVLSVVLGFMVAFPVLLSFVSGQTGRLKVFSVFSFPRKENEIQKILAQGDEGVGDLTYYLFHSESLNFLRGIMGRWFNHFGGRFLFFEGDYQNPRHSAPNHGMLLFADLILIPTGLFFLAKERSKLSIFVLSWLLLSPLPSALSRDQVHAVRALNMVVPLTLISSSGFLLFLKDKLSAEKEKSGLARIILAPSFWMMAIFISLVYYLDSYFIHLPKHNSEYWGYGYKEIVETITPIQDRYKEIKVQQSFAQPYIYFLFYQKYDPLRYQKQARLVESEYKGDVGYIKKLDNICFCAIDWPQNKKEHGILVVADAIRIPETELKSDSVSLIKEIKFLDGTTAFRIVEVR